jgi:proteic killer suppression protein
VPVQAYRGVLAGLWETKGVAIRSFATKGTEHIFDRLRSKVARKTCPEAIWPVARRKLDLLNAVNRLRDLAIPRGNELEALKGDRKGQHSIRINEQYRVCFRWTQDGPEDVEITDYH